MPIKAALALEASALQKQQHARNVVALIRRGILCRRNGYLPTFFFTYHFGDLNGPPITFTDIALTGSMPYGVRKICNMPNGYKPISFTTSDTIDYTKNNTGLIYYFRVSTKKYYTRSTEIRQDDLCSEEYGVTDDGNAVRGCVRKDTSLTGCNIFLDFSDGTTYDMYTYVISNNIVLGVQKTDLCSSDNVAIPSPFFFHKLQGFRDQLLALALFDKK